MNPRIHCAPQNFYMGMDLDIVCASPIASQYCSVQYMRRSFASGSRWDPPSTGRDCFLSFIGGEDASVGGHESTLSLVCMYGLEIKKGALPFGGRLLFITERVAPVFLQKWWGDYFRNLKLATIGGSIAVPLQTRKKQMRLRTIAMTIQIPITIQPRKGMTARTNESAVTTWIFRA